MKIAVFGAGAIGGVMGAALARAGVETTLIARGPHLEAMRACGLTVRSKSGTINVRPRLAANGAEAGRQDMVIVALKAQSAVASVAGLLPMLGPETAVVTAMNGMPWWYFHGVSGPLADRTLETVDPGARQWTMIGPRRAIGCVVYPAAEVVEPGVVEVMEGDRFVLGEPDGTSSKRVAALARALVKGGLKAPVRSSIRTDIWLKLWGNAVFNPLSALTGATLAALVGDPLTRALARAAMTEAEDVARALGVVMPIDVDARIAGAGRVGEHKTSMLQDLERGRPMEIDALVAAVAELGRLTDVPTPLLDGIYALVRRRAIEAGCYPKERLG
ncbi:MAG: 2-dehydropantoate 2-reductase [Alphaproteobacteria bacterium]|nr:2-dehydropantoate 2-reductase [Alphaproteobacteria bacterium]